MQHASGAESLIGANSRAVGSARRLLHFAASVALFASTALADDRFNVCSITINSDDEIRTLQRRLSESKFRFIELTDYARTTAAEGKASWFGKACESGVHCDVLVVSGHFGNTWAGSYGTTFAGSSGVSLSLEELEERRCDQSCPGILGDPLEVYLLGCKTLASVLEGENLPPNDIALLARHQVPPDAAERIVAEVRTRGDGASSRERMRFVFAGVPRLYGFTDVAPSGRRVAPLLESYLASVGDYAEHLRRLKRAAGVAPSVAPNEALARALQPTCFAQCEGLQPADTEYQRAARICALKDDQSPLTRRVSRVEALLDEPGFLTYLPAIDAFFRQHPPASYGAREAAALEGIRGHRRARAVVDELLLGLDTPVLRLEALRLARSIGWISEGEALPIQRRIAVDLLRAPIYGEARDLICGMGPRVLGQLDVRAEDVPPQTYRDEFGIQALACLRPADERIHERLAASLFDAREWIARLTAQALRALKPSDPRVLAVIHEIDPSFRIDWL